MGFGLDTRGSDWRDDQGVHFTEPDRDCFTCSRAIQRGVLCPECGAAVDEGGEAG